MKMAVLVYLLINAWWKVGIPDLAVGKGEATFAPATACSPNVWVSVMGGASSDTTPKVERIIELAVPCLQLIH